MVEFNKSERLAVIEAFPKNLYRSGDPITISKLSKRSKVNRKKVKSIVNELLEDGIIYQTSKNKFAII